VAGRIKSKVDTRLMKSAGMKDEVWYVSRMKLIKSIAALIMPFLVTGCYEISMDLNVNDDGSGTYEVMFELDLITVAALLAEEGEDNDLKSICDDALADAGIDELADDDSEVTVVNDGMVCRQITTGSWEAGDPEIVGDSAEDLALTQVGDGWRLEFNVGSLASDDDDEEMDPAMLALMGVEIIYSLTATLPGSITEHNGELSANTVSWEVNLLDPLEEEMLYMQSAPEGSSNAALVIVIIIALVLLAGVSVFLLRRKTSSSTTSEAETAEIADSEGNSSTE
jgi:hypothetical protein